MAEDVIHILILTRKLLVDPEEFLAFVHHPDETTEARVFGFEQGVEFAQGGAIGAGGNAISLEVFPIDCFFSISPTTPLINFFTSAFIL